MSACLSNCFNDHWIDQTLPHLSSPSSPTHWSSLSYLGYQDFLWSTSFVCSFLKKTEQSSFSTSFEYLRLIDPLPNFSFFATRTLFGRRRCSLPGSRKSPSWSVSRTSTLAITRQTRPKSMFLSSLFLLTFFDLHSQCSVEICILRTLPCSCV